MKFGNVVCALRHTNQDNQCGYDVKSTKIVTPIQAAYYFRDFMLDEWEVRSYTLCRSPLSNTTFCLISMGYHLELDVAISFY